MHELETRHYVAGEFVAGDATPLVVVNPATDAPLASLRLFGVLDPADELVAAERRDPLPQGEDLGVGPQGGFQIGSDGMDGALRQLSHPMPPGHGSSRSPYPRVWGWKKP